MLRIYSANKQYGKGIIYIVNVNKICNFARTAKMFYAALLIQTYSGYDVLKNGTQYGIIKCNVSVCRNESHDS